VTADDDRARFQVLFEAHRSAVLLYARRRVDRDAAADVVAETFLVAWRRLDAVPEDPLPWLYGVARKVVGNHRRALRRSQALVDRLADARATQAWAGSPEHELGAADALRRALAGLSDRDREALRLVAWEGLDAERAAVAAGCSRAAFAVRLHRARRRLAAALDDDRPPALPMEVTREA
jgi:RNA polymerase sigma factor (sigma-70 family)